MTAIPIDRRTRRHQATRAEIIEAAWTLAREQGLSGISMRDLGTRVGMRAQSVYTYFPSKDAIYDAMYRQGYEEFIDWMRMAPDAAEEPLAHMRRLAHRFFLFCTSDPVRYQLLFLRTIPGFEPSPESYAIAVRALGLLHEELGTVGVTDPEASDLATAVFTGLTSQQIANDPGGQRWERLVDRAAQMVLAEVSPGLLHPPARTKRKARP